MKFRLKYCCHLLAVLLLLTACQKDSCFYGSGSKINRAHTTDKFATIQVYGMFDIELQNDSLFRIELEGGENILEKIESEVSNDTLFLTDHNACQWFREKDRVKIKLKLPDLQRIDLYEPSYLHADSFKATNLYITAQCDLAEINIKLNADRLLFYSNRTSGGKYQFKGSCKSARLMSFYLANLDALDLECDDLSVLNESISDLKVWANKTLKVEIYNKGNVLYRGNPEIIIDSLSSIGRVIRLEE